MNITRRSDCIDVDYCWTLSRTHCGCFQTCICDTCYRMLITGRAPHLLNQYCESIFYFSKDTGIEILFEILF